MSLVADGLLFFTALTSGIYCWVLSRRLRRLGSADDGIGSRIEALSTAITETKTALADTQGRLDEMRKEARLSGESMARETARAKRLADDLTAATAEAERTLDQLYSAEKRVSSATAVPLERTSRERLEIVDDQDGPDLMEDPGATETQDRMTAQTQDWNGDDVLRVERMSL